MNQNQVDKGANMIANAFKWSFFKAKEIRIAGEAVFDDD